MGHHDALKKIIYLFLKIKFGVKGFWADYALSPIVHK